ncbi:hypothetical protein SAMN00777080_3058 [Aquiflexum balticum DSM 16537]|uniref:DUF3078 domain-containing protein n=1 Tax=Aquiflexum balticum DSM 16537 TaxID=758820 RepID=A0A1W2H665_9BACT|nr:hypothetical protein [Aquiflexum balticum]SMD44437.1 hypothetical protein SAMN00777080_3058 [Aquiflexum balticum DSM 16537]
MKKLFFILLLFMANSVKSQENEALDVKLKFKERVSVRKSFQTSSLMLEPAVFTITIPENKTSSWLFDGAISYEWINKEIFVPTNLRTIFEYHRNTLIEKEQFNYNFGLNYEKQWRKIGPGEPFFIPVSILNGKFNKDLKKGNESLMFQAYFTFYYTYCRSGCNWWQNQIWKPGQRIGSSKSLLNFIYFPYVGIESENRIRTELESQKGSIYRWMLRFNSNFFLLPKFLNEDLVLGIDFQIRRNFSNSVQEFMNISPKIFRGSLNYTFLKGTGNKKGIIGLDYTRGEDPSVNFEKQAFWAFGLKFAY